VVILKDRNFGIYRAFVARFESGGESRFAGIGFSAARPPSYTQATPLTEEEFLKELDELMRNLDSRGVFSGTLLFAKDDEVLFRHASGEASKRFHIANDIDTKFNLGSMNKMFTSTAVMQLVEQKRLSLEDTLDKFLDDSWLPGDVTSKITIHHLLTHTSGLGSYFNETYAQSSRLLFRELDDYKPLIKDERPAFTPGERYSYSNTGMFLLGVVIEKVTGENYFDYIRKNIADKAGLADTDCYEMDYPVENLAIGYSRDRNSPYGWQNNLYKHVVKGGPAGGGFSTVTDLFKFARALVSGKLVSKNSLDKMWTDQAGAGYGYGFSISEGPAGKVVGHSGGFSGINSNLDIFLDRGYTAAVMSNYDMGATPVADWIEQNVARIIR
jgi:CubicO group peptidase (beta-lactamase class C family)